MFQTHTTLKSKNILLGILIQGRDFFIYLFLRFKGFPCNFYDLRNGMLKLLIKQGGTVKLVTFNIAVSVLKIGRIINHDKL